MNLHSNITKTTRQIHLSLHMKHAMKLGIASRCCGALKA